MSLATRCPACGTTFRIEPEQLALADGWARCGRCSTVFDAAAQQRPELADDATSASTNAMSPPGEASNPFPAQASSTPNAADAFGAALASFSVDLPPPSTSRSQSDDALEPSDDGGEADAASSGLSTPTDSLSPSAPPTPAFDPWRELPSLGLGPDVAAPAPVPSPVATEAPGSDVSTTPPSEPMTVEPPMPSEAPATTPAPLWTVPPSGSAGPASGPSGVRPSARAESVAPSGVIHAASEPVNDDGAGVRKPRGAGRRSWRLAMLLLAIVLLLALLAQVLYRQRDAVAARHPALRPALARLCGFAGCTIAALRRPGAIAIEGATFTHVQDSDRYRMAFALRNQADVPLAMPAIELSLLDAQQRPVVRRVLMPAEFGATEATLPALAERAGAVSFVLDETTGTGPEPLPRVAGYAMVAFYP
ncbi:zinc-ribbon and DUF3426 domain-containing protein [Variovorax sp. PvP013]|uniref:zinc-ribbon and DUF3426 domain-containing protein n=1 Tax=Variovorax sp. PvP013 TaxID=3156435 RepID=UPI003D19A9EA